MKEHLIQSLQFDWMGKHSGYHLLAKGIKAELGDGDCELFVAGGGARSENLGKRVFRKASGAWRRAVGAVGLSSTNTDDKYRYALPNPDAVENTRWVERKVVSAMRGCDSPLLHTLYGESQVGVFMASEERKKCKWIASIHQPPSWWKMFHEKPEMIAEFDGIITLGVKQRDFACSFVDPKRVSFIRHPVESAFFVPGGRSVVERLERPRILFGGRWLRDCESLCVVAERLLAYDSNLSIDLLVKVEDRFHPNFIRLGGSERVRWHSGLSDGQLLTLVQNTTVLLMPLLDAVANNGIIEAVSCGIPIVSTDVGDVRDYLTNDFGYCAPVGAADGLFDGVVSFLENQDRYGEARLAARQFAERELAIENIAKKVLRFYKEIE